VELKFLRRLLFREAEEAQLLVINRNGVRAFGRRVWDPIRYALERDFAAVGNGSRERNQLPVVAIVILNLQAVAFCRRAVGHPDAQQGGALAAKCVGIERLVAEADRF
jgi:hypothetical protein